MSNRFSCSFIDDGDFTSNKRLVTSILGKNLVYIGAYYFFYCAQPNATSASIQNVKTNLREYHVNRLKINYFFSGTSPSRCYMIVFVLCVPQDYSPAVNSQYLNLSELPNYSIPENVLYHDFIVFDRLGSGPIYRKEISIDIKKSFRVSPSYKLVFSYYVVGQLTSYIKKEGTVEVFFDVN